MPPKDQEDPSAMEIYVPEAPNPIFEILEGLDNFNNRLDEMANTIDHLLRMDRKTPDQKIAAIRAGNFPTIAQLKGEKEQREEAGQNLADFIAEINNFDIAGYEGHTLVMGEEEITYGAFYQTIHDDATSILEKLSNLEKLIGKALEDYDLVGVQSELNSREIIPKQGDIILSLAEKELGRFQKPEYVNATKNLTHDLFCLTMTETGQRIFNLPVEEQPDCLFLKGIVTEQLTTMDYEALLEKSFERKSFVATDHIDYVPEPAAIDQRFRSNSM